MRRTLALLLGSTMLLLSGCASLLNRQYVAVTPSSDNYWESEDNSTLRAQNYQELVNDLLILVSTRTERGLVRLYGYESLGSVEDAVKRACREVQVDTALGSYTLDYLTFQCTEAVGCYEADIVLHYRRTQQQQQSIVQTSSTEAIDDLLVQVVKKAQKELVVNVSYSAATQEQIRQTVWAVQQTLMPATSGLWTVNFYPAEGPVEIVEILLTVDVDVIPDSLLPDLPVQGLQERPPEVAGQAQTEVLTGILIREGTDKREKSENKDLTSKAKSAIISDVLRA